MDEIKMKFTDIRSKFMAAIGGNTIPGLSAGNQRCLNYWVSEWRTDSEWMGGSSATMLGYLNSGFIVDGLNMQVDATPVRKRRRPIANDCEGDFNYDLWYSGDENCYTMWTKRESIPGLYIDFGIGFLGGVPAKTIADYSRWVLRALMSMETYGVDTEINAYCVGRNRTDESRYIPGGGYRSENKMRWDLTVKKMGQTADYLQWSALFSPGCYRILGFFTNIIAANEIGKTCNSGMGGSCNPEWSVKWDAENRRINISHDSGARDFPEEKMTNELMAAIQAARS